MRRIGLGISFVAILFLTLFLSGCSHPASKAFSSRQTGSANSPASSGSQAVFVGYQLAKVQNFKVSLDFYATIVPILQADIHPKNSGWLTGVFVNTGDRVEKGELLAQMDHVQLDQAVFQGEAELESARKLLQSLEAAYQSAEANVARQKAIVENDRINMERDKNLLKEGYVSEQNYDNMRTTYVSDKASLDSLQAELLSAESQLASQKANVDGVLANLQIARANLSDASLRAPFSGVVTMRNLDPGAFLSTAVTSTTTPVVSIADLTKLKVMVSVADTDVPKVHPGQEALITTDAFPGRIFKGIVTRMAQSLDPTSRTLSVEVDIPNPDEALKPGMYAHVSLVTQVYRNAVVVPLDAVVFKGDKKSVWVITDTPQGTAAQKISVEIGAIERSDAVISNGLKGNERIVTQGKESLKQGVLVKAQQVGEAQVEIQPDREGD